MLKQGNGKTETCVNNLLRLTQGEIAIDQLRGTRADITDKPITIAKPFFIASARWVIDNYEPRAAFGSLDFTEGTATGDFNHNLKFS